MTSQPTHHRNKRRTPQRAVPQSVRRSGKPLFFGWGAHLTHHEREQVKERIALTIGIVLAVAIVGIIGYGIFHDKVLEPMWRSEALNRPVAQVGSVKIKTGYYRQVVKFERYELGLQLAEADKQKTKECAGSSPTDKTLCQQYTTQVTQIQSSVANVRGSALTQLINTQVILQKGPGLGLDLTSKKAHNAEIKYLTKHVKSDFGTALTERSLAEKYKMSMAQFNTAFIYSGYYAQQMGKILAKKDLPAFNAKVQATKKRAENLAAQLRNGASWKTLAKKDSGDTGSASKGGRLGWASTSQYVPPFKKAANTLPIGQIAVVRSVYGFHVMQVLGRKHVAKVGITPGYTKANVRHILLTLTKPTATTALQKWLTKEDKDKSLIQKFIHPQSSPFSTLANG
jgi:foldase protein PrsA